MRKILTAGVMLAAMALMACNTIEGAGKDITATGKAVSSTADDAKH